MIGEHEFNTKWWGSPVGIVKEASFFELPAPLQRELLAPFAWVEFTAPLTGDLPLWEIRRSGFVQVDTQIPFRLRLKDIESISSHKVLQAHTAADKEFEIRAENFTDFKYERFLWLGIDRKRLNKRYEIWGHNLMASAPETCLQITHENRVQGWYLSRSVGDKIELTLAMLHKDAEISGVQLYRKAFLTYAEMGFRLGGASFSIANTAVHNIYARLGARFSRPVGCWMQRNGSKF